MINLADVLVILVLVLILGSALWYIHKEKKRGVRCIGCPAAGTCAKRQNGSACGSSEQKGEQR